MLHHPEAGHLQLGLELGERAAVTHKEPVEQEAPRRVGQRLEDTVVVGHAASIGDQMVTCQPEDIVESGRCGVSQLSGRRS